MPLNASEKFVFADVKNLYITKVVTNCYVVTPLGPTDRANYIIVSKFAEFVDFAIASTPDIDRVFEANSYIV